MAGRGGWASPEVAARVTVLADNCHRLISKVAECGCVREPFPGELTAQESQPLQTSPLRGLLLRGLGSQ